MPRRSARIHALSGLPPESLSQSLPSLSVSNDETSSATKRKRRTKSAGESNKKLEKSSKIAIQQQKKQQNDISCLPRTRELELTFSSSSCAASIKYVMGIDEAGRGPLAGPVVAAAVICPDDIVGVVDSKKITKEEDREALYETIMAKSLQKEKDNNFPGIQWAVAVIDAKRIDEINILQAALEGMRLCATALVDPKSLSVRVVKEPSVQESGCYVVHSNNLVSASSITNSSTKRKTTKNSPSSVIAAAAGPDVSETSPYFALIDGNKVPKEMPCPAECIVKGDSKEFSIAAASILAKVTRDRLMHGYSELYPKYNLSQHKGYPTAAHMKAVMEYGASPIHRRTFAPLKHMEFDENGAVIVGAANS